MEIIRGKQTSIMTPLALVESARRYDAVHIDLGTGDGRFVQHTALNQPARLVIGIDACRENLYTRSRLAPANALFVIASAQQLPAALSGLATQVTINFPWGSLLTDLLTSDSLVLRELWRITSPGAALEIRLNAGALNEAGWTLEEGIDRVSALLMESGFSMRRPVLLTARELTAFPTTWAKRLAFGREPRAIALSGRRERESAGAA